MLNKSSYLDQYRIIKTLGSGYHAKVKLAEAPDQKLVAIKRFKSETANLGTLQHELGIMSKLHHQNLVNLIQVKEHAVYRKKNGTEYNCFAIVLEYVGGGELFDFIALGGKFSPNVSRTYFHQMMNGLAHMHKNGVAHRDIKPQNILLTSDFVLKLADFGFSALLEGKDKSGVLHTKLGTQGYMAPEIQLKNYVGTRVDIFAAGVILFIMYSGSPPFERAVPNDTYYKLIKDKNFTSFWNSHSKRRPAGFYPDDLKDLLNGMFAYNPNERYTLQQIANHPWTKGPTVAMADLQSQFQNRKKKIEIEQQKQRQQKQKQKNQRSQAIFGNTKFRGQEDALFIQNFANECGKSRNLTLKRQVKQNDFVIEENEDWVFTALQTFVQTQFVLVQENQQYKDELKINGKYELNEDKITATFNYEVESTQGTDNQQQQIVIKILVEQTPKSHICLSFERVSGNSLFYKKIVNRIKEEFLYCKVQQ